MTRIEIIEYTDPTCSWAWGTEPKLRWLRWSFGDRLQWRRVLGGLVPNRLEREPDFDAVAAAPRLAVYWSRVTAETAMPYPVHLQHAPVSSIDGCIAVKAAERQGDDVAGRLLRRLRESCFVFADPADTPARIRAVAAGTDGLDLEQFDAALDDPSAVVAYQRDWEETRTPNTHVLGLREDQPGAGNAKPDGDRWRYVFPTLIVRGPEGEQTVPGWKPIERYLGALEAVSRGSTASPRPAPTLAEAFATWPLLTERELEVLCGWPLSGGLPPGTVTYDWGEGCVFMTAAEADRWAVLSAG